MKAFIPILIGSLTCASLSGCYVTTVSSPTPVYATYYTTPYYYGGPRYVQPIYYYQGQRYYYGNRYYYRGGYYRRY